MNPPDDVLPLPILIVLWLGLWACFAAWIIAGRRLLSGKPLIAFERRRQVPWGGLDLLLVFVFYVFASAAMMAAIHFLLGPDADKPAPGADAETSHAIVQLFRDGDATAVVCCVLAAVCVAPIVEEFLVRVLLQGWLEKIDQRLGPAAPSLRRILPWSVGPILLSSFIFAMLHFRVATEPTNREYLLYMMVGNALVGILTAAFATLLIWLKNGATAADFGFVAKRMPYDIALGLSAAAATILPIFAMQITLSQILPKWLAADPLPLFCFALVLGTLYCRTHRVVASVVLHMCLNTASLTVLWLSMAG